MFEFIGLLFATAFLFAIAAIAAGLLGIAAWLTLRRRPQRTRLSAIAILLPFATATYWWICTAVLPSESLFGDIDQPLANGYHLKALGKMPEYGTIEPTSWNRNTVVPAHWIDSVGLEHDVVYGHFNEQTTEAVPEPFFLFDMAHDSVQTFANKSVLESALGHTAMLYRLPEFLSPDDLAQHRRNQAIEVTPPLFSFGMLLVLVIRARRKVPGG